MFGVAGSNAVRELLRKSTLDCCTIRGVLAGVGVGLGELGGELGGDGLGVPGLLELALTFLMMPARQMWTSFQSSWSATDCIELN